MSPAEHAAFGERIEDVGVRIIRMATALPGNSTAKYVGQQVVRSGLSAGANYCEARGAESRADFAHKMQVVLKELRETFFWLAIIEKAKLIGAARLSPLRNEIDQLIAISVTSVLTAKANARRKNE